MYMVTWRAARTNRGLTLREVAEKADKSVDTIIRYEKDSTEIPRDLMLFLINLYQVPGDMVYFGRESDFTGLEKRKKKIKAS